MRKVVRGYVPTSSRPTQRATLHFSNRTSASQSLRSTTHSATQPHPPNHTHIHLLFSHPALFDTMPPETTIQWVYGPFPIDSANVSASDRSCSDTISDCFSTVVKSTVSYVASFVPVFNSYTSKVGDGDSSRSPEFPSRSNSLTDDRYGTWSATQQFPTSDASQTHHGLRQTAGRRKIR